MSPLLITIIIIILVILAVLLDFNRLFSIVFLSKKLHHVFKETKYAERDACRQIRLAETNGEFEQENREVKQKEDN